MLVFGILTICVLMSYDVDVPFINRDLLKGFVPIVIIIVVISYFLYKRANRNPNINSNPCQRILFGAGDDEESNYTRDGESDAFMSEIQTGIPIDRTGMVSPSKVIKQNKN